MPDGGDPNLAVARGAEKRAGNTLPGQRARSAS
jgi:hypothetical protein